MIKRIGVWNTAFLGDAVLTLPLIATLKATYPAASIDFWVRRGFESLFIAHPDINEVYAFDKKGGMRGLWETAQSVRVNHYDVWINAHTSPRSALVSLATKAPQRIGYDAPYYNTLVHTDTVSRRFYELDEIERLLQLTLPLEPVNRQTWPTLVLPESAHESAACYWERYVHAPVLGIHPGSVWETKRWRIEGFAELARRAVDAGAQVMLFAGPGEMDVARHVVEYARLVDSPALLDVTGKLSLCELGAYLARVSCYVSNDSGPMHMAWAQHTPVTALFGPTVRELGFYPRGEHATVIERDLSCRPCGLHGARTCPQKHHRCMRDISAELVWEDVQPKLFASH